MSDWFSAPLNTTSSENGTQALVTTEINAAWRVVLHTVSFAIICLLALGGNSLVAITLLKKDLLVVPSNRLVFSLTASNFALALVVFPFAVISSGYQQWLFGIFWCNFTAFLTVLIATASYLTMAVIAIDRYYAIVKPMMYTSTITNSRTAIFLLVVWLLSFTCSLPPLFGWSQYKYRSSEAVCLIDWCYNVYYTSVVLIVSFLVPFTTMSVCYYFIFQVARRKTRRIHVGTLSGTPTETPVASSKRHSSFRRSFSHKPSWYLLPYASSAKSIRTICLVMGVFIGTGLLYIIVAIVEAKGSKNLPGWFHTLALGLACFSTASHPIVYGLYNRSIRKEMKAYLCSSRSKRGLSRFSSRHISISASLLDYSPLRFYRPGLSRRASFDTGESTALDTQVSLNRRGSQDSGAVMNESDHESEGQSWCYQQWRRRLSAPSRLQHVANFFGRQQETQTSHPLPILNTIHVELTNIRAKSTDHSHSNDKLLEKANSETCISVLELPPTLHCQKVNGETSTADPLKSEPSTSVLLQSGFTSVDEGIIVHDCVIENLE